MRNGVLCGGLKGVALCVAIAGSVASAQAAGPEVALALRAGTPGIGGDLDVSLMDRWLNARVGYSAFDYNRDVNSSDATYHGKLKLSMGTGVLDWYVFGGGFHLTAGVVANQTKVDVTGVPSAGVITVNNTQYTSAQLGSVSGQMKFGHSTEPYVGLGWGNPVGTNHRVHFLFDLGAIYGGTPNVTLTAQCGPAAPQGSQLCNQAQADVLAEQQKLANNASLIKWYPIVNFGVAVRL